MEFGQFSHRNENELIHALNSIDATRINAMNSIEFVWLNIQTFAEKEKKGQTICGRSKAH